MSTSTSMCAGGGAPSVRQRRFDVGEEKPLLTSIESMGVLAPGGLGEDGLDQKKDDDAPDGNEREIEDRREDSTTDEPAIINDVQIYAVHG